MNGENKGALKIKELRIALEAKRQKLIDEIEQFLSNWMVKWVSPENHTPRVAEVHSMFGVFLFSFNIISIPFF